MKVQWNPGIIKSQGEGNRHRFAKNVPVPKSELYLGPHNHNFCLGNPLAKRNYI